MQPDPRGKCHRQQVGRVFIKPNKAGEREKGYRTIVLQQIKRAMRGKGMLRSNIYESFFCCGRAGRQTGMQQLSLELQSI